jgi:hypothetical protein
MTCWPARTWNCGILRVQFHQLCPDLFPAGMPGQDPEQVAALPGAQADHPERTRRALVQRQADPFLDDLQAPR